MLEALILALVICVSYLGYQVGAMRGKAEGYAICVAEEDNDTPRQWDQAGRD